mmetsp:Transcript_21679/g.42586  ORF Transcript_21679/g.42586 Transcript_21679/m.42586 type:complete len:384 (-) Transcript_21679:59-1210(-)
MAGATQKTWKVAQVIKMLSFGDGTTPKPPRSQDDGAASEQIGAFQNALIEMASAPGNFLQACAQRGPYPIDLKKADDRDAAIEITQLVPGVSKWKPSLVPSRTDENTFYANFFSHVVQVASEYFSDERNLEAFYAADDLEAGGAGKTGVAVEMLEMKSSPAPAAPVEKEKQQLPDPPAFTPVTVEQEPTSTTVASETTTFGSEEQVDSESAPPRARFAASNGPEGARSSEMYMKVFLQKKVLFYVSKSENNNVVVYEANLDASGKTLDPKEPVKVYWILYARTPCVEEGLTILERNTAYGSTCKPIADRPGHYLMTLSAIPSKPIEVWVDESGELHAQTSINGMVDELLQVAVQSSSGGWLSLPRVDYIDLMGLSSVERIDNK